MPNDTLRTARKTEATLMRELLEQLLHEQMTTTRAMARLAGGIVNDVLAVETIVIPADGYVHRQYRVAVGLLEVRNLPSQDTITVVSAGPSSAAPTGGIGVYKLPADAFDAVHLASRQFTIYGTADDVVSFQALSAGS